MEEDHRTKRERSAKRDTWTELTRAKAKKLLRQVFKAKVGNFFCRRCQPVG